MMETVAPLLRASARCGRNSATSSWHEGQPKWRTQTRTAGRSAHSEPRRTGRPPVSFTSTSASALSMSNDVPGPTLVATAPPARPRLVIRVERFAPGLRVVVEDGDVLDDLRLLPQPLQPG